MFGGNPGNDIKFSNVENASVNFVSRKNFFLVTSLEQHLPAKWNGQRWLAYCVQFQPIGSYTKTGFPILFDLCVLQVDSLPGRPLFNEVRNRSIPVSPVFVEVLDSRLEGVAELESGLVVLLFPSKHLLQIVLVRALVKRISRARGMFTPR